MMKKKHCCRCGKKREVKNFYKNGAHKDGLSTHCKDCSKKYVKENYEKK